MMKKVKIKSNLPTLMFLSMESQARIYIFFFLAQ